MVKHHDFKRNDNYLSKSRIYGNKINVTLMDLHVI